MTEIRIPEESDEIEIPVGEYWNTDEIETDYANTGSFEDIFTALFPRLYRHAEYEVRRLNLTPEDVREILQTAASKAHENWDKYEQGTYALAWLKKIITNTAHNLRRKNSTNREMSFGDMAMVMDVSGYRSPSSESQVIEQLSFDELRAMFDRVEDPFRQSLKMVLLDEMPYKAVAEELGIPLNTVLTRVHRGRARLRELITEQRNTEKRD